MPTAKKASKKLDPNKVFTIMVTTRATIAEDLNAHIDAFAKEIKPFTPDDPRLTDEMCQNIAENLYEGYGEVDENDYVQQAVYGSVLEQFEGK